MSGDGTPGGDRAAGGSITLHDVHAGYGGIEVLRGIDLTLRPGRLTALIGPNGAGKSTLLRCVTGLLRPRRGEVRLDGTRIDKLSPSRVAALGVCQVPEGRRLFGRQSIADNLMVGGWVRRRDRARLAADRARMFERFPILGERRHEAAASLSGGEAQMLAIAMALMARPSVLILDEPSLGLAPMMVTRIIDVVQDLARDGVTVLLVEQMVHKALAAADDAYVLGQGRIVLEGPAAEIAGHPAVKEVYLGSS